LGIFAASRFCGKKMVIKNNENTSRNPDLSELSDCVLCPRECHANRIKSPSGWCKSGAGFSISSICIHRGEEPPVSGEEGICNIFFTNCNLQCIYCQNWQISDNKMDHTADDMDFEEAVGRIASILDRGIKRVGFVSPSHFIPQMLAIIREMELRGYKPVWVYNSNGYDKVSTLKHLEGIIDVYLPDLKYMVPELSKEYSDAVDYPDKVQLALNEMFRQKGSALHLADDGTALSGIIIRHLVLPGETKNSMEALRFIARDLSPKMHISLMSQYNPTPAVSCHPELNRTVTPKEYEAIIDEMDRLGIHNGWIQEIGSHGHYRPDFLKEHPFE
jgi:putative pyruvate formate lyase activating enzyme